MRRSTNGPEQAEAAVSPAQRPYRLLARGEIELRFAAALQAGAGVEGAHCIHELWMRGEFAATIESALTALWRSAAVSVPDWLPMRYVDWLKTVYEVTSAFPAARPGPSNVYLVLLDCHDRRRGPYGIYV
ncbi:MAG: hypothetical protein JOZ89_08410, partial [Gammaproteobacteria bacterium]|nr:hypothetical protein [Gammaproteobacteria bacterium]